MEELYCRVPSESGAMQGRLTDLTNKFIFEKIYKKKKKQRNILLNIFHDLSGSIHSIGFQAQTEILEHPFTAVPLSLVVS